MANTYEDRMIRVLDYIFDNPTGDLSLDALADVAAMSRFHWHRVFVAMTGETCAQAVRRVRLARGAGMLVQTDDRIEDIAKNVGYGSIQAFSRAFRAAYGVAPDQFRQRGDMRSPLLKPNVGDYPMFPVEITQTPACKLVGVPHTGNYLEIGKAFEHVTAVIAARNLWPDVRGMGGLYYDDPASVDEASLRSFAGLYLADRAAAPDGLELRDAPSGKMAVMHYKGPYAGLAAAYQYLFGVWLPQSGEEIADAPALEVYLNNPRDTAPDDLLTDVSIQLK